MKEIYDMLLFDLDGTISDPLTGIARSINYAMEAFGFEVLPQEKLARLIGPPINEVFKLLTKTESKEFIGEIVGKFRERYSTIGYSENTLYPGVRETLNDLHENSVPMAVCTSKRVDYSQKILEMFHLQGIFRFVNGGDIGISKKEQIARMLDEKTISQNSLMIGDRAIDITAAHANGLESAGVLWGYGSSEELEMENPSILFSTPEEWKILEELTIKCG
jgi:phosphoglycolate phosphatase